MTLPCAMPSSPAFLLLPTVGPPPAWRRTDDEGGGDVALCDDSAEQPGHDRHVAHRSHLHATSSDESVS